MKITVNMGEWWNDKVLPVLEERCQELMAKGLTRSQANDAIVHVLLEAVRRRQQKFHDKITGGGV